MGVSSKTRIYIVSPGGFIEIALDDDSSADKFMSTLRKIMKRKYTKEEREMKIDISEVLLYLNFNIYVYIIVLLLLLGAFPGSSKIGKG